jgi:ankyrin repeat protein
MSELHDAAAAWDVKRVAELLAAGADVNAVDAEGRTALHVAAASTAYRPSYDLDAPAIYRTLIDAGSRIDARDRNGDTPLDAALRASNADAEATLRQAPGALEAAQPSLVLLIASRSGDAALVAQALARGADPNATDDSGVTPLMAAVAASRIGPAALAGAAQIVDQLLAGGADVHARNDGDETALHFARRNAEIARRLLQAGADANVADENGRTPLFNALEARAIDVARVLLAGGADPRFSPGFARAFEAAVQSASPRLKPGQDLVPEAVALLLEYGGGEVKDLFLAAFEGHLGVVRALLDGGVDPNDTGGRSEPPLLDAVRLRHESVARLLVERGADPLARNKDGRTAVEVAARECTPAFAEWLRAFAADRRG